MRGSTRSLGDCFFVFSDYIVQQVVPDGFMAMILQ